MLKLTIEPSKSVQVSQLQQPLTCNCKQLGLGRQSGKLLICQHNNLRTLYPKIAAEWDYSKNKFPPEYYSSGTETKVFWVCSINFCGCHYWQANINSRTGNDRGCPYCSNKKVCPHNNLETLYPDLCRQWDFMKNTTHPSQHVPLCIYQSSYHQYPNITRSSSRILSKNHKINIGSSPIFYNYFDLIISIRF